ncbi:alpha-(1,3)-fucosyltransferase C-like [Leguminivora glycinivorella]|uniref:alpha-(1,3)-fucosyltransferase C-like n=1 Tax=Leguminivora glycinivorella TaxID=1035111 RepID=UPI00200BAD54|nr:alpha-(1,3)-fucosyltransferase C-like [Leguminivora glycinivorella]
MTFKSVTILYSTFFTTVLLLCIYRYPRTSQKQGELHKRVGVRYILLWTDPTFAPLKFLRPAFVSFTSNRCEYTNCYVSSNASELGGELNFDVVLFNGRHLPKARNLPRHRSPKQKYVYVNMESSPNYPVYDMFFDGYFNWTWTYKLKSDLHWGYFSVYDTAGQIVGPKIEMHWQEMSPISNQTKARLLSKSVAAAWFVSHCSTLSNREGFAKRLENELHRHGLKLDIVGRCGRMRENVCTRRITKCYKILENNYYFYLSFENSYSEDYVTEKVLTPLQHYTVPIVFGGANYSRFLPPGSYLDALELGVKRLAARMAVIIDDHRTGNGSLYYDFFRWRNHYRFRASYQTEGMCNVCKLLNDPTALSETTVYTYFSDWWMSESPSDKVVSRITREKIAYRILALQESI